MHVACPCKSHLKPSVAHPQPPPFLSPPTDLTVHELLAYGSKGTDAGVWPSEREFWPFWVLFAAWSEWQCLSLYWLFPRGDCKSRHESRSTDDEQFYGQSQSKMVCRGVKGPELVPKCASSLSAFKKTADANKVMTADEVGGIWWLEGLVLYTGASSGPFNKGSAGFYSLGWDSAF